MCSNLLSARRRNPRWYLEDSPITLADAIEASHRQPNYINHGLSDTVIVCQYLLLQTIKLCDKQKADFYAFHGDLRMQKFTECIRTYNNNDKLVLSCLGIQYTNFIAKLYRLFYWDKSVFYTNVS